MLTDDPIIARPAEPAPAPPGSVPRSRLRPWRWGAAAVALAALSLLLDSAPTYDPWAWIIWGREIIHWELVTTTGPSWKPFPILFTTPFALFGEAAPALWLVVARTGAIVAVGLAFALVRALGAGRPAALAAAATLAVAPWWTVNAWLGNSEGLLVAFVFGAILAHLRERPRTAFWLAVCAGLLRPEAWPFLGLYALWLVVRDRGALRQVAAGLLSLPLLWLVPEQLGSGDLWRASNRAQTDLTPGASGRADDPAMEVLRDMGHLLTTPAWIAAVAAVALGLAAWRAGRGRAPLALAALAAAWTALVAVMTALGYSGNVRYLIAPAAIVLLLAAVGAAAALDRLPVAARVAATVGVLALFALPGARDSLDQRAETAAQSRIPADLRDAVERAGGTEALARCGPLITEPLLVPQVAWRFDQHLEQIHYHEVREEGMVIQGHVSPHLRPFPRLEVFAGLPQRELASAPRWRIVAVGRCAR